MLQQHQFPENLDNTSRLGLQICRLGFTIENQIKIGKSWMKTKSKFLISSKSYPFIMVCVAVAAWLSGVFVSSAQTGDFLYSGAEQAITLNPGAYDITAYGAEGSTLGAGLFIPGLGAEMSGEFYFSAPAILTLLVGGTGTARYAGGGGGSFIVNGSTPLVVAGGGGAGTDSAGGAGLTGTSGGNGEGGSGGSGAGSGGGGGGYSASGSNGLTGNGPGYSSPGGSGGLSFEAGGSGGEGLGYDFGGYGGGGSTVVVPSRGDTAPAVAVGVATASMSAVGVVPSLTHRRLPFSPRFPVLPVPMIHRAMAKLSLPQSPNPAHWPWPA